MYVLERVIDIELSQVRKFLAEVALLLVEIWNTYMAWPRIHGNFGRKEEERCRLITRILCTIFLVDLFSIITLVLKSVFLTSAPMTSFLTIIYY